MENEPEAGFTLVELLVVMLILGVLAAIAIPALLSSRDRAQEATVKADVKEIAKEVLSYYVDGSAALRLQNSPDGRSWQIVDGAAQVVAQGPLSARNSIASNGTITSDSNYCVSIQPASAEARPWQASEDGLVVGDCR